MTSTEAYLALNLLPKIGPVRVRRLLEIFESPERVLASSRSDLRRVEGIGAEMADQIAGWENHIDLEEEKRRIAEHDVTLLTLDDDNYPPLLRNIHDPPFLLYVRGEILPQDQRAIGIVGSRRCTHYGREAARKLSFQLAHAGLTVISGLARGIDTAAHEAALAAEGRTIAVLGSGVGNVYPPENQALADRIIANGNGAVISEFPVLYVPDRQSFPLRNRIVSGMSEGLLVAEAPTRSGSLITANQALEQGRSVYAVPGPIDRDTSSGCNHLIQQGAKLVIHSGDILEDLDALLPPEPRQAGLNFDHENESEEPKIGLQLSPEERAVLSATDPSETQIETITERCQLPGHTVSVVLLQLEMKRLVKQLPGKYFAKLI